MFFNKCPTKPAGSNIINLGSQQAKGLVAFWSPLDSDAVNTSTGGSINNLIGRPGKAVSTNGVKKIGGPNGPALLFTSSSSQKLTATGLFEQNTFNPTNPFFTISLRARFNTIGAGLNNQFLERDNDSTSWGIQFMLNDAKLRCYIVNQAASALNTTANTSLVTNRWYHLAVTYDGANSVFYVDGKNDGGGAMAATGLRGPAAEYTIGASQGNTRYFNGALDDIRVYNRVLRPAEILDIYQNPTRIFRNNNIVMSEVVEGGGPGPGPFNAAQFFMVM